MRMMIMRTMMATTMMKEIRKQGEKTVWMRGRSIMGGQIGRGGSGTLFKMAMIMRIENQTGRYAKSLGAD